MNLQVVVHGGVEAKLEQYALHAPKYLDRVLRLVGSQYRAMLKKNYLSGQMIGRQSGDLYRSIYVSKVKSKKHVYRVGSKAVKSKQDFGGVAIVRTSDATRLANIYEHAGGYSIQPKTRKALMFVTPDGQIVFTKRVSGQARPFMSASSRAFNWSQAFSTATDKVVTDEFAKLGIKVTP